MSEVFRSNPWFASLAPADAEALLAAAVERRLGAGEMLFRQGDIVPPGQGAFYGLAQGHLRISSLRHDGREAIFVVLEPGNWFGEISLIDGLPRTHDATAMSDVALLEVEATAFERLMGRASFARHVSLLLATRMRALYAMVEQTTLRSTRARVAHRLLQFAHGDATLLPDARRHVPVSHEVLAMMLGISRPTLHKELKELEAGGSIALGYRRIEVIDLARLAGQARE